MTSPELLSPTRGDLTPQHPLSSQRSGETLRTPCEYGTALTEIVEALDGVQLESGTSVAEGYEGGLEITYDLSYVFPKFSFEESHPKKYKIVWNGNMMGTYRATSKHFALCLLAFDMGWGNMEQLRYSEDPVLERDHFYGEFEFV
ncbi:hypothetical protein [Pararhizobium sp. DWP3-4]|uniref:hypothetical protein n=1 Tax=Pararhizobium sp. DWP3-4 TaxID=2804565 RepID=UPI003CF3B39E